MSSFFMILLYAIIVICSSPVIFFFFFGIHNRLKHKRCSSKVCLVGKTIIVTGSSAGIGKEAARDFACRGARVILACRNKEKAQKVAEDIISTTGNRNVVVRILDTSLLTSVRAFAKEILQTEDRLDVLVLNAGIGGQFGRRTTEDNLELIMTTNHFGHFLLAHLLLGLLKKSHPSRIVVTTSVSHNYISEVNLKNLNFEQGGYGGIKAYSLSKLCNILFTKHFGSSLQGKGVTINCTCPGFVKTEIIYKSPDMLIVKLTRFFLRFMPFTARTEEEGAQTIIYLAVDESVKDVSGVYFVDCKEQKPSKLAEDINLAKKVCKISEELVKLTPQEMQLSRSSF